MSAGARPDAADAGQGGRGIPDEKLYKQQTGIGLSAYISELKLGAAKRMLAETGLKVSEIAGRIGFESGYFSRYFKKVTQLTPQEYREKIGK